MNRLAGTGLALSMVGLVAGCSSESTTTSNYVSEYLEGGGQHIGESTLVRIVEPAQDSATKLKAGDECLVLRGATFRVDGKSVFYQHESGDNKGHDESAGTECPDGTKIKLSPQDVATQAIKFSVFAGRRAEVINQLKDLKSVTSDYTVVSSATVSVVNPKPVSNETDTFKYGDLCRTNNSKVLRLGKIASGELAMQIVNQGATGATGDTCPNGTIYLASTDAK